MVRQLLFRVWIGSKCGATVQQGLNALGKNTGRWFGPLVQVGWYTSDDHVEISSLLDIRLVWVGAFPETAMRKDEGILQHRKTTESNYLKRFIGQVQRTSMQTVSIFTR